MQEQEHRRREELERIISGKTREEKVLRKKH